MMAYTPDTAWWHLSREIRTEAVRLGSESREMPTVRRLALIRGLCQAGRLEHRPAGVPSGQYAAVPSAIALAQCAFLRIALMGEVREAIQRHKESRGHGN